MRVPITAQTQGHCGRSVPLPHDSAGRSEPEVEVDRKSYFSTS